MVYHCFSDVGIWTSLGIVMYAEHEKLNRCLKNRNGESGVV